LELLNIYNDELTEVKNSVQKIINDWKKINSELKNRLYILENQINFNKILIIF